MKDGGTISIEDAMATIELDDICMVCAEWSGYTWEPIRDRVWEVSDEYAKADEATLLKWLGDPENLDAILEGQERDIFRVEFDVTDIRSALEDGELTRPQQLRVAEVARSIENEEHLYANMGDIYLHQALEELAHEGMNEVPSAWIEQMRDWFGENDPISFNDWRNDGPGAPNLKDDMAAAVGAPAAARHRQTRILRCPMTD